MKNIELMREYMRLVEAGDKEPWKHFEYLASNGKWVTKNESSPFYTGAFYRLKPKTISINGFKVPEPESNPLDYNETYFYPAFDRREELYEGTFWLGDKDDTNLLERGLIHKTKEAAIAHAKALLSFTEVKHDD